MPISELNCLTVHAIRSLAGDRWFARGEVYLQQGRVNDLSVDGRHLAAYVTGTETYRVRLSCQNARIEYSCTCPVGEDGNFCKHCVAVGLTWAKGESIQPSQSGTHDSNLRSFLEAQEHQKLVDLIVRETSKNRRLRDQLELDMAREQPTGPDVTVFRKAITSATRTTSVDYYSMPRFARRLSEVIDSIKSLLDDGHAKAVIELTEYAFTRLEKVIGFVDDSDGHFSDILPELEELHHSACQQAPVDPLPLAKRLFDWELNSEWEFFSHAAANYADVLGADGLREYQRLVEEHWSKLPVLNPGDRDVERHSFRYRITSIMETLAKQSGDLEALVAVKQRDLSHPYSFLQIAEIYQQAKQYDKALGWAERGLDFFSTNDPRISDFLAVEYHRRGRHAEAMNLIWQQFVESPSINTYQKLRANALKVKTLPHRLRLVSSGKYDIGTDVSDDHNTEWLYWRENALCYLREKPRLQKEVNDQGSSSSVRTDPLSTVGIRVSSHWHSQSDRSLLVEVFLWEKQYEEAWEEATAGGCTYLLWRDLARAITKEHPDRAFLIYQELIAPTIAPTNNMAYGEAIKLLAKMHKLASQLDREREFDDYLVALRTQYKAKRNFIKLLDEMIDQANQ